MVKTWGHEWVSHLRGDGTFQGMVLGRSMHSSAAGSVKQGKEEDISGRAARTGLH